MKEHVTVFAKSENVETSRSSRFARLDSASRKAAHRSLTQLAIVYASAYFVGFFYYWYLLIQERGAFGPPRTQDVVLSVVAIAYALWVAMHCRTGTCSPRSFARTAQHLRRSADRSEKPLGVRSSREVCRNGQCLLEVGPRGDPATCGQVRRAQVVENDGMLRQERGGAFQRRQCFRMLLLLQ